MSSNTRIFGSVLHNYCFPGLAFKVYLGPSPILLNPIFYYHHEVQCQLVTNSSPDTDFVFRLKTHLNGTRCFDSKIGDAVSNRLLRCFYKIEY